jgi:iron complex outermembrane receptor protein
MLSVSVRLRGALLASVAAFVSTPCALAQSAPQSTLPAVTVDAPKPKPAAAARPQRSPPRSVTRAASRPALATLPTVEVNAQPGALTVLSVQQALKDIQQTPGGVALVPAEAYKNSTVANTIKDILEYVPGVFAQPKWGDDTRLSIRGSGLSRNFHLRGVQLYMDGIPINTSDGYGDFQEIDPTAYKYVAVYKGGNALQFGANSLGGAINFVTPSGRDPFVNGVSADIGAFGYRRLQANAGGVNGAWDGFITASTQSAEGFRDHSDGHATRLSGNVGYQISPDVETRFYLNANEVRQRIPGSVSKASALNSPTTAACQQDHDPVRQRHHGRIRRLRRRSPFDAPDLPVAG